MRDTLKWSYAMNQWDFRMDVFVRHSDQVRAFKTLSALGFDHVELPAPGSGGRWENLGHPRQILLNHGSIDGVRNFLAQGSIAGISSHSWDPGQPAEESGFASWTSLDPGHHDAITEAAKPFIDFLAQVGGDQLVVRPVGSAWMTGVLPPDAAYPVGDLWNRVGEIARAVGVGLSLHYDCLCAFHTAEHLEALLDATDPSTVGLALDTAEFAVAGIDPVAFYLAHPDRVTHVHLKNTRFADTGDEYLLPAAEITMLKGGGGRRIERWFYELGTEGGLVDVAAFVAALREREYRGWVVVESDHGGDPAELAMLNSWYLQRELGIAKS